MDPKVNVAVIGGDARYLEMIRQLTRNPDVELLLTGFEQLNQGFTGAKQVEFEDLKLNELHAIILPVPGMDSEGYIETVFSNKKIQLKEKWFQQLPENCLVFSGIATPALTSYTDKAGIKLIPLFNRDDVAIYNSIPTVEGTIMMAIQHTDFTIHSSKVIVLGFGRVGMTLASKFAAIGADVWVGTRYKEEMARITEMGLTPFHIDELSEISPECDILLNTVPALVVTKEVIRPMKSHSVIIDLASKPGGTDFKFAEQRGIKALPAPGLPGIVAPKTAGEILGNVVSQILKEHQQEGSK
ncbi:dipicolinic acid synthetase subunit A [Sediminibacillus massiliensis]|uniref:dipicolinic acid synthetase subunit A n=1 Tax=Sediminibacillus massiliensis TaxID=1926277 RepID=UPI0015C3B687|nr:dipicolinic acid synthetase subunit A [Sediminibacillus massiliensis]